jgi:Putative zinc-finger
MRGHVDAESLALYAEGQLSRGRAARVRAHLSGCPECAATVAALAEVTAQLRHVPAAPMPAAVAARLDAALSAEAAAQAPAPAPTGAPRPPRRNPLWSPGALRILAATGVALVAAGGVGYAVSQSGSSGPSSGTSGVAAPAASRQHRPTMQAAPNVSPGSRLRKPHTSPNAPSGTRYVRTGTDYRPGTFVKQASKTLALYDVSGISGPGMLPASSVPRNVAICINQVAHGRPVRLADLARYQQHPATVIVLGNTVTAISSSCTPLHSAQLP